MARKQASARKSASIPLWVNLRDIDDLIKEAFCSLNINNLKTHPHLVEL
jgi:hypothetical protein